jgi:hypothetical protein
MRSSAILIPTATVLMACTPDADKAAQKPAMSLAQAEAHCEQRANSFARRPLPKPGEGGALVGLLAEYPDDRDVQWFYRSCVRANSGISTKKRVDWRL